MIAWHDSKASQHQVEGGKELEDRGEIIGMHNKCGLCSLHPSIETSDRPTSRREAVGRGFPYLNLPIFLRWENISPPGTYSSTM